MPVSSAGSSSSLFSPLSQRPNQRGTLRIPFLGTKELDIQNPACYNKWSYAGVAELADALDLGSSGKNRAGSSPVARTITSVLIGFEIFYKDTRFLRLPPCRYRA